MEEKFNIIDFEDLEEIEEIEEVITPNKGSVTCCQRFEFLRGLRSVLLGPFKIK